MRLSTRHDKDKSSEKRESVDKIVHKEVKMTDYCCDQLMK